MTASLQPLVAILALLASGEAASANSHPNLRHASKAVEPFYKQLASKVGSLTAAAAFHAREQKNAPTGTSPSRNGSEVLQHWAVAHDTPAPSAVKLAADELSTYALRRRDQARMKAAAEAHAMMHEAESAPSIEEPQQIPGKPRVQAEVQQLGRDLLKQWSSKQRSAPPATAVQKMAEPANSKPAPTDVAHGVLPDHRETQAKLAANAHSKHAHDLMRAMDADKPDEAPTQVQQPQMQPAPNAVATGGDLLVNWANAHVAQEAIAPKHEEVQSAAVVVPKAAISEAIGDSVTEDLRSLRSSMHGLEESASGDVEARHAVQEDEEDARQAVQEDRDNLKKATLDMESPMRKSGLHAAMHVIGSDVPDSVLPASEPDSVSDSAKTAGADALEQWSKSHRNVESHKFMPVIPDMLETAPPPKTVVHHASDAADGAHADQEVDTAAKMQEWRKSSLHASMRTIGSDVAEHDATEVNTETHIDNQKVGADTLEQWSEAHKPKQAPAFHMREQMSDVLLTPSKTQQIEKITQTAEPNSRASVSGDEMQSSMRKWHESAAHDAMRSIGSDAPDTDVNQASVSTSPSADSEAAGGDLLDQWAEAHKKAEKPKYRYMPPVADMEELLPTASAAVAAPHQEQHVVERRSAPVQADTVQAAMQAWHTAAAHEAMRSIGSDIPDVDVTEAHVSKSVETLKASGSDELDQWSRGRGQVEVAKTLKFMPRVPTMAEMMKESVATLDVPTAKKLDVASPAVATSHPPAIGAENMQDAMQTWHAAAAHDAMRSMASDVADTVPAVADAKQPAESLKADGADELAGWSKAHEKLKSLAFSMTVPSAVEQQIQSALAPPVEAPLSEEAKNWRTLFTAQKAPRYDLHKAMHNIASDVPQADMTDAKPKDPADTSSVVGAGVLDQWARAHEKAEKSTPLTAPVVDQEPAVLPEKPLTQAAEADSEKPMTPLVDMYPPTAAPEQDMLALAMARGFGKKADEELQAPMSKVEKLHKAMQSMDGSSDGVTATATGNEKAQPEAAASQGADILSQWAKKHR
jgi:hypothetical protein